MGSLEALLLHLERLDEQLPTREIYLHQDHLKVVKEVLLTKREIKRRLSKSPHAAADPALRGRLDRIHIDRGYNIDRVNELYRGALVCPYCCATDVAVITHGATKPQELDYAQHRNPRVRLVQGSCPPAAGKFSCNGCFSSFEPPLPPHVVKLCEMLFKYYY
jgi:hypothetical protein